MRFVSKSSNLAIILKPSFPGNHLTGVPAVNGVSVKFQNGSLEVKDDAIIEMLLKHPAYNLDFIKVEETEIDPFTYIRKDQEPEHVITEINYGHAEKSIGNKKPINLSPEVRRALQDEAMSMAKAMAKEILPGMLKEAIAEIQAENATKSEVSGDVKTSTKSAKKMNKLETNVKIEDTTETVSPAV